MRAAADGKALVRELFEKVIAKGDEEAARRVLSDGHVFVDGFADILGHGVQSVRSLLYDREIRSPGLRMRVLDLVEEPGKVAAVWEATGTSVRRGEPLRLLGMSLHVVRDGKIARSTLCWNPFVVIPKL